jgi:hypothetical protein
MSKKKEKWQCPLCLGYDHPPSEAKLKRYYLMDALWDKIYEIFQEMFWETHKEPDDD